MSLGFGIALLAIGAILVYALDVTVDWIDLDMVGYILMVAGAIGIVLGLILMMRKRRTSQVSQTRADPLTGDRTTRSEVDDTGL